MRAMRGLRHGLRGSYWAVADGAVLQHFEGPWRLKISRITGIFRAFSKLYFNKKISPSFNIENKNKLLIIFVKCDKTLGST